MESSAPSGLECGYGPIDAQHADLFQDLELLRAAASGEDASAARSALDRLVQATRTHFAWEEARMSESRFADAAEHSQAHRAFLEECDRLAAHLSRQGVTPLLRLWVNGRFSEWFRFHTRGQDGRLGRHLAWWETAAKAAAAPRSPTAATAS